MQKVLAIGAATARQAPPPAEGRVVEFPEAPDRVGRTFVCSVLFLDIVEYSKKPIGEQLQTKERFNTQVSRAIAEVPAEDRIILDTGDGVAISFLGDPEDTLSVALALAPAFTAAAGIPVRVGINLGPVRLTRDINGQPNIIGDGINVAQRVMSFAQPGQILVSRGYHEVVTRIAEDYAGLFAYQGSRTDKHVREHEIFELVAPVEQAHEVADRRKRVRKRKGAAARAGAASGAGLLSHRGLAYALTGVSALVLVAAIVVNLRTDSPRAPAPAPARAIVSVRPAIARPAIAPPAPAPAPVQPQATPVKSEVTRAQSEVTRAQREAAQPSPPSKPVKATEVKDAHPAPSASRPAPATRSGSAQVVAIPARRELAGPESAGGPRSAGPGFWKPEPAAPATPKVHSGPTALVLLAISPWGEVFVDGKSMGVSPPLAEFELAPGKHRIVVRNGGFKPFLDEVDLGSNETVRIKHKFVQPR